MTTEDSSIPGDRDRRNLMNADIGDRRFDVGRLLIVPIFTVLLAFTLVGGYVNIGQLAALSLTGILGLARIALISGFYGLLIGLYLLRGRARASSRSPLVNTVAVVATFLPLTFATAPSHSGVAAIAAGDLLMVVGLGWSLFALAVLRKNISIIPQARRLVRSGPYAVVRHPLYVGEIVTAVGVVVGGFSWPALVLVVIWTALQVFRALHEEALLATVFAEYDGYRSTTPRFIPGLV